MTSSASVSLVVLSRYAGALVDLAEKESSVKDVQKDLHDISSMIDNSDEFARFLVSPLVGVDVQQKVIDDISKKAKFCKLTQNFLSVLVQNRRLNVLSGIIQEYDKIVAARSGEVSVRVEVASKLSAAQEKDIKKRLSASVGSDVLVETVIRPDILGGMIVTIGSYMVDDSVRRKLERLGSALKQGSNQNNNIQNLKEVI